MKLRRLSEVASLVFDERVDAERFEIEDTRGERHQVIGIFVLTLVSPPELVVEVAGIPKGMSAPGWKGAGVLPFGSFRGRLIRVGREARLLTLPDPELLPRRGAGRWGSLVPIKENGQRPRSNAADRLRFDFHCWSSEPPSGRTPHTNYRMPGLTLEMLSRLAPTE